VYLFFSVNKHILYIHSEIANTYKLHSIFLLICLCFHRYEEHLSQYIDWAIFDSRCRQDTVPVMKMSRQVLGLTQTPVQRILGVKLSTCEDHSPLRKFERNYTTPHALMAYIGTTLPVLGATKYVNYNYQ